jgi:putative ABC transport system permease protein
MERSMVGRMVVVEAVIVALIGAVLGLAIGIGFGWALQAALAGLGVKVLDVPLQRLAAYMVVAALAGVVAAIWPAWRASRLDVLRAIAYE